MNLTTLLDRILVVRGKPGKLDRPATRRILTLFAALVFIFGSVAAVHNLDLELSEVNWVLIFIAGAVGVPLTALVNAWEYATSAHILGHRPRLWEALRVSVIGTAANLLPIPGATLVRMRELRSMGSGYRPTVWVTVSVGLIWIATASVLVGVFLVLAGNPQPALFFLPAGVGATLVAFGGLSRTDLAEGERPRALLRILMVEMVLVAVGVFRHSLVLSAIGVEDPMAGAVVLVLSAALAGAAGIFPGGLGLREVLSALLAPVAGVSIAAGFVGAAVNRVLGAIGHALLALALGIHRTTHEPVSGSPMSADYLDG